MCTCFFWILLQLGRANREMCCLWDKWSMAYLILSDSMFAILVLSQSTNQSPPLGDEHAARLLLLPFPPSRSFSTRPSSLSLLARYDDSTGSDDSSVVGYVDRVDLRKKKHGGGTQKENTKKRSRSGNFRISVRFITTKLLPCLTLNLDVTCPSLEDIVENLENGCYWRCAEIINKWRFYNNLLDPCANIRDRDRILRERKKKKKSKIVPSVPFHTVRVETRTCFRPPSRRSKYSYLPKNHPSRICKPWGIFD